MDVNERYAEIYAGWIRCINAEIQMLESNTPNMDPRLYFTGSYDGDIAKARRLRWVFANQLDELNENTDD